MLGVRHSLGSHTTAPFGAMMNYTFAEVCLNDMDATRDIITREAGFAISYYAPSYADHASSYRG